MRQVEKDTGRRLIWAAVNHHDTDNPHVHIVVRGVDRDGDDLRIDRGYLAHGMRWPAQEILTRELGRRPEMDISMGWGVDVGREAFTEIDRAIVAHSSPDGSVALTKLMAAPDGERRACLDRLQVLEEMQLATKESPGIWRLADGWKELLVQAGRGPRYAQPTSAPGWGRGLSLSSPPPRKSRSRCGRGGGRDGPARRADR
jgi:type IV secretory pathway VirD2 relaxase